MIWVLAAIGIPCAGVRTTENPDRDGHFVLDVCILGQHLPQVYAEKEIRELHGPDEAESLGMCRACLGYGTMSELPEPWPYSVDEVPDPCPGCGGTGRPCLRIEVRRSAGTIEAVQNIITHSFVKPWDGVPGMIEGCLGCGEGPRHHYHPNPN